VGKIRAAISAGDYYQANLTRQFSAPCRRAPERVADELFAQVKPGFGVHLRLGDFDLISISPELLVECRDGQLLSRPVAGSRPRGKDRPADARLRRELAASAKDRAEHEMLVDLARNDLGKVARFGSVRVSRSRRVETHARVLSMVSTIEGLIAAGHDGLDALWAAFPGGTISGCPKRAVTAALRRLEPCGRGFYTGSLGWLENGEGVFNILIRTLTLTGAGRDRRATWGAGGGIVYDSEAEAEWRELLAKGETLQRAVSGGGLTTKAQRHKGKSKKK
jgi:para-aminobenzoate synthetase component 1